MSARAKRQKAQFEAWQREEAQRRPALSARARRLKKYGLTPSLYERLHKRQGGVCVICSQARKLVVDHDHKTGRVRGLLCHRCNTAIGMLENDPERARAAAFYLEWIIPVVLDDDDELEEADLQEIVGG